MKTFADECLAGDFGPDGHFDRMIQLARRLKLATEWIRRECINGPPCNGINCGACPFADELETMPEEG